MATCDFREVPVEADRVYSKTQCGNYWLKRPHAKSALPGSNGPHPRICTTKVWSKFCFQLCQSLQGDEVLLTGKGVDILDILSGSIFLYQFLLFCITGMFVAAAQEHQGAHIYSICISTHKFVFIKWKSWKNVIQNLTKGTFKVFSNVWWVWFTDIIINNTLYYELCNHIKDLYWQNLNGRLIQFSSNFRTFGFISKAISEVRNAARSLLLASVDSLLS